MQMKDFSGRIKTIAVEAERETERTVRQVALSVDQTVVMATPVDTGRARSNWIARLGAAATSTRAAFAPGQKGSTASTNSQAAIDAARAVIAGYTIASNPAIFISNNLPYIGRLNDGWSSQAPANFVEQAVQNGAAAVRNARIIK